jgi:hypothetical protein
MKITRAAALGPDTCRRRSPQNILPRLSFYIGIWQVDTEARAWLGAKQPARLAALATAVERFWASIEGLPAAPGHTARGLFLAPEYLFVHEQIGPDGANQFTQHHMNEADTKQVSDALWALSARFPALLLVPGSLLSRRAKTGGDQPLLLIAKHRSFVENNLRGEAKKLELAQLETAAEQGAHARYLGTNRAMLFMNGLQHIHDKVTDVSESWDPETTLHIGGNLQGPCQIDGIVYGVELCKDHHAGYLASTLNGRRLDVQLVLSAHLDSAWTEGNKVAPILIHACSVAERSGVYSDRAVTTLTSLQTPYPIQRYQLTLP